MQNFNSFVRSIIWSDFHLSSCVVLPIKWRRKKTQFVFILLSIWVFVSFILAKYFFLSVFLFFSIHFPTSFNLSVCFLILCLSTFFCFTKSSFFVSFECFFPFVFLFVSINHPTSFSLSFYLFNPFSYYFQFFFFCLFQLIFLQYLFLFVCLCIPTLLSVCRYTCLTLSF
jgi:hypothetical protein